ncbi:MAG: hypothetical protein ACRCXX_11215 [Cetobacterium sp.]|uniref:hypothetical protein n=1 Tax=Cetobacterium sp. TaxID=2071632 RepID=UPI003F350E9A
MATSNPKYFYYFYSKKAFNEQNIIYEKLGRRYKAPKVNYGGRLVAFTSKSNQSNNPDLDAVLVAQGEDLTEI